MHNTSLPRTKIDCFTQDALTQIKDTLNNQTPSFTKRGGVGKDVRELSDFALQQIKDAVGSNGGGGGETKRIVSGWQVFEENDFDKINKKDGEELFEIDSYSGNAMFVFTTDENEPETNFGNVALIVNIQNNAISITNIGVIILTKSQSTENRNTDLVAPNTLIGIFENFVNFQSEPYLTIAITYTERM